MENEFCASVAGQGASCALFFNTPAEKECANHEGPLAFQNSFPLLLAPERMTKEDMKTAPETTPTGDHAHLRPRLPETTPTASMPTCAVTSPCYKQLQ